MNNQDNITIQGPPLQPTTRNPRTIQRAESKSAAQKKELASLPTGSSHTSRVIAVDIKRESEVEDSPGPSQASTRSVPLPSPRSIARSVLQAQSIFNCEDSLDALIRLEKWIPPLAIVKVQQNVNHPCTIPLCPYILSHVLAPDRTAGILPYAPLWIPGLPQYSFHLLYVLKENISSPQGNYSNWIAVFLIHFPNPIADPKLPRMVGSITEERFINFIQTNVQNERLRMRTEIISHLRQVILNTAARIVNTS